MFRFLMYTTFLAATLLFVFCSASSGHPFSEAHDHNVVRSHTHHGCPNDKGQNTKSVTHSHSVSFAIGNAVKAHDNSYHNQISDGVIDWSCPTTVLPPNLSHQHDNYAHHTHSYTEADGLHAGDTHSAVALRRIVHQHDNYVEHSHANDADRDNHAGVAMRRTPEPEGGGEEENTGDGNEEEVVAPGDDNSGESVTPDSGDTGGSTVTQPNPTLPQPPSGQSEPAQTPPPASDEQVVSVPVDTSPQMPAAEVLEPIEVTEYMVRDWSPQSGGGLPQWVELYNPNPDPVGLKGYTFQYATRAAVNHPYRFRTISISEATIAPESTLIFVTRKIRRPPTDSAIQDSQIYNLKIENVLKRGWKIISPDNIVIHQIGTAFGNVADPVAPPHQNGARVSHHVIESVAPSELYYYGAEQDIGAPGFHEPALPAAPALIRPKKISVWADLKRRVER